MQIEYKKRSGRSLNRSLPFDTGTSPRPPSRLYAGNSHPHAATRGYCGEKPLLVCIFNRNACRLSIFDWTSAA